MTQSNHLPKQQGFTLVEILVTMVVVAIGLLGFAGLQVTSLKNNHTSLMRSQATLLADDIVESMRVNRDAAISGAYDVTTPVTGTVAGNDLVDWKARLESALPGGSWTIDVTPGASPSEDPATVVITISWTSNIGAGSSFETRTSI